jgi:hypothetical protein
MLADKIKIHITKANFIQMKREIRDVDLGLRMI